MLQRGVPHPKGTVQSLRPARGLGEAMLLNVNGRFVPGAIKGATPISRPERRGRD